MWLVLRLCFVEIWPSLESSLLLFMNRSSQLDPGLGRRARAAGIALSRIPPRPRAPSGTLSPPRPHASATKLIVSRRFTPARRRARLLPAARARCLPRGWGGGNRGWMERGAGWLARARVRGPGPGLAFLPQPSAGRPYPISSPSFCAFSAFPESYFKLSAANWRALGIGEGQLLLEAFCAQSELQRPITQLSSFD